MTERTLDGRAAGRGTPRRSARPCAVVGVMVESPLPHLDRPFDYLVPNRLDAAAQVGQYVSVPFGHRRIHGWIVARREVTPADAGLKPVTRVLSRLPLLDAGTIELIRTVADRRLATFADVVRLAVPPRHAAGEDAVLGAPEVLPELGGPVPGVDGGTRTDPSAAAPPAPELVDGVGAVLLDRIANGQVARATVLALPAPAEPAAGLGSVTRLTCAQHRVGGGVLVVAPDLVTVERLAALVRAAGVPVLVLTGAMAPAARHEAWLRAAREPAAVVLGTRAATYAPVRDLRLCIVVDEGHPHHREPRAPQMPVPEVLQLRAWARDCSLVSIGPTRSVETERLVERGWLVAVDPPAAARRAAAPTVRALVDDGYRDREVHLGERLPPEAFTMLHRTLPIGPVLVQVQRAGSGALVTCRACGAAVVCPQCGLSTVPAGGSGGARCPSGCLDPAVAPDGVVRRCGACDAADLRVDTGARPVVVDVLRRALPRARVIVPAPRDPAGPRGAGGPGSATAGPFGPGDVVVSTPGTEPTQAFAGALIVDPGVAQRLGGLRGSESAFHRWMSAAARVVPRGTVVIAGASDDLDVQALVRWDAAGHAREQWAQRRALGLPPARRAVVLTGPASALDEVLAAAAPGTGADVLGPTPVAEATPSAAAGGSAAAGAAVAEDALFADPESRVVVLLDHAAAPAWLERLGATLRERAAARRPRVGCTVDPETL